MSNYGALRQALLDRNIVTTTYEGHYREVCPHAIGREEGQEKLFCYQFGVCQEFRVWGGGSLLLATREAIAVENCELIHGGGPRGHPADPF